MRYASTAFAAAICAVLLCPLVYPPLYAQSAWLPPIEGTALSLEGYKARYDVDGIKAATSVWFFSARLQLGYTTAFRFDIPFSYYDEDDWTSYYPPYYPIEAEHLFGNPYVGLSLGPFRDGFTVDIGGRLPLAPNDKLNAMLNGWFTDFSRMEAFLPDAVMLQLKIGRTRSNRTRSLQSRSRAGMSIWIPTDLELGRDLLFDWDINVWYRPERFAIGGMFAWRFLMSADGGSFTQRSEFEAGIGATLRLGAFEPGVHARMPLHSEGLIGLGTAVQAVFGLNLTVHLGKPGPPPDESPVGPRIGPRGP